MKKWRDIKDQPITWGGYAKLCGVSVIASAVYSAGYLAYIYREELGEKIKDLRHK